jgi:hypothetical protein
MRPTTSLTARGDIRPQSPASSMGADIRSEAEVCCANDLRERCVVAEPAMIVMNSRRFISLTNYPRHGSAARVDLSSATVSQSGAGPKAWKYISQLQDDFHDSRAKVCLTCKPGTACFVTGRIRQAEEAPSEPVDFFRMLFRKHTINLAGCS